MASQTRFFGPGDQHGSGRIAVRVVTIRARDLAPALPPALAAFQRGHLIGNQYIVGHGVFDDTGARVTLRAGPHSLGHRQLAGVEYAQVARVRAGRG